jgi:uncharacterized protein (TIGR02271 family)
MPLHKIKDFDPDYRSHFDNQDLIGSDLYSGNEKIGSVHDLLVDDEGRFRYLVVDTGPWIFGKKVLLPVGRTRMSVSDHRVYVDGLTRDQVNDLPKYDDLQPVDYDHEEQVRNVYRPGTTTGTTGIVTPPTMGTAMSSGVTNTTPPVTPNSVPPARMQSTPPMTGAAAYDRNNYTYDHDPSLYNMNDRDHQNFRLYEERLVANKTRRKTGDVVVNKRIETQPTSVSVPVEKERVVIEERRPADINQVVTPGETAFREGEVARMEVYEETPDIRKETVLREEVNIRKEVSRDTVDANETVRRERLDVRTEGTPRLDKRPDPLPDDL